MKPNLLHKSRDMTISYEGLKRIIRKLRKQLEDLPKGFLTKNNLALCQIK